MNRAMLLVGAVLLAGVVAVGATLGQNKAAADSRISLSARASTASEQANATNRGGTRLVEAGASLRSATTTWRVLSSYTAHRIANAYLDTTANGIYMIVKIAATNSTSRSMTLSVDQVFFDAGGARYAPDPDSITALELGGHPELAVPDLAPEGTTTGWVAFDVPPTALGSDAQVCFRNRGFTTTAGCIATD